MKRVLVTGATGFIGNYVIRELLAANYHVIATSLSREKAASQEWFSKVTYIPFDLRAMKPGDNYFEFFGEPEMLIHLAWEGLPNYTSDFHISENLPRHYTFIENLVRHGLKDITVTGTCFEYGLQEGCLSENMASLPANPYAVAKNELRVKLEELCASFQASLKWVRLFYMYGSGQSPNSLLSQLQSALERGDKVFNMSPGDQLRDYLPVEKVAAIIVKIASQDKGTGIINCCSGMPIEVKELVIRYLAEHTATIELNLGHYPYPTIEPRNFWGDTSKLKNSLTND